MFCVLLRVWCFVKCFVFCYVFRVLLIVLCIITCFARIILLVNVMQMEQQVLLYCSAYRARCGPVAQLI